MILINNITKLTLILFIFLLLPSAYTSSQTNLSMDEAIAIAESDSYVADWIATYNGVLYIAEFQGDLWWVGYYSEFPDMVNYLDVYIDDNQGIIVEISEKTDSYWGNIDQEIIDISTNYLNSHPYYNDIISQMGSPIIEYWPMDSNQLAFNVYDQINYEEDYYSPSYNYNYSFGILVLNYNEISPTVSLGMINSNLLFGELSVDFNDVQVISESTEEVSWFISNNTDYMVFVNEIFVNQSLFNEFGYEGIYFDIRYDSYSYAVPGIYYPTDDVNGYPDYSYFEQYEWVEVIIDDQGVLIDVFGTYSNILSSEEIIEIALNLPELASFFAEVEIGSLNIYSYFDGYGTWTVEFSDWNTNTYAYVSINDSTSEILDYWYYIPIQPTLTEYQVLEIYMSNPEIANWIDQVGEYWYDIYYDWNGYWYIYLYDTYDGRNYLYSSLEDQTGEIIFVESFIMAPPRLTEQEIVEILIDEGIQVFVDTYPDAYISFYYDGSSNWYLFIYSATIIEAYITIEIDDLTGQIRLWSENHPSISTSLNSDDISALVHQTTEYIQESQFEGVFHENIFYYEGIWYAYVEYAQFEDSYSASLFTYDHEGNFIGVEHLEYIYWIYEPTGSPAEDGSNAGIGRSTENSILLSDMVSNVDDDTTSTQPLALDSISFTQIILPFGSIILILAYQRKHK